MKKYIWSLVIVSGLSFQLYAQDLPAGPYDLQTAVNIALENNLTLKRSELNQLSNEATVLQNKGARLPTLSTGASTGFRWGRSVNPVTNLFETARIGNVNLSANSSVTLFAGSRISNNLTQSKLDLEAGIFNIEATKNNITLNIINLFVNVVFNREQVNIAESQLTTSKDQLDQTTKLVAAGSLPLADKLDLQAQNATNELEVINAKNSLRISKLNLAQAMQIPFTEDFQVVEPEFIINDGLMASENPSDIFETAVEIMPEIKLAKVNVESAEYGVKIARGSFLPTVGIGGNIFSNYVDRSFGSEPPSFGAQIQDNLSQSLNLNLSIPIFSQFNNMASVQRARVQKQISEVAEVEAKNTLRQDIESAYNSALSAQQSYEANQVRLDAVQESFRIAQQRLDVGAINSVDYQVAQNNLFNTQADLLNAKYTYIFRVKVLDFYLGNPINLN
jgi:outer membrane protein